MAEGTKTVDLSRWQVAALPQPTPCLAARPIMGSLRSISASRIRQRRRRGDLDEIAIAGRTGSQRPSGSNSRSAFWATCRFEHGCAGGGRAGVVSRVVPHADTPAVDEQLSQERWLRGYMRADGLISDEPVVRRPRHIHLPDAAGAVDKTLREDGGPPCFHSFSFFFTPWGKLAREATKVHRGLVKLGAVGVRARRITSR